MATHSSTLAWKIPWAGGAWWAAVHGVAEGWTRLSDFTFHRIEITVKSLLIKEEVLRSEQKLSWR